MREKDLIQDIYQNYERRQQDNMIKHMQFIEKKVLPLYRCSPFKTVGVMAQLRKIMFVEIMYQVCRTLILRVPQSQLTFAAIFTDISLVENEFFPQLRIPNKGLQSAEFVRYNFGGFLHDVFDYDPKNDIGSIIPAIESSGEYVGNGDSKTPRRNTLYGPYLYDTNNLSVIYKRKVKEVVDDYASDFFLKDKKDKSDVVDEDSMEKYIEKAVVYLRVTYGPNGSYQIVSRELQDSPEITTEYNRFRNELMEF